MFNLPFPIACVILASGIGQRFGANKLLAQYNGQPLVQHILDISENIFCERVIVTRHKEIASLCQRRRLNYLLHNQPYLNDTVRLGTAYIEASQANIQGLLFATADQPLLKQHTLIKICQSFMQQPQKIHRLYYNATPGNPVIFPLQLLPELKTLPQDKGGSVLIKKYPELVISVQAQEEYELFDVDTQKDWQQLLQREKA